MYKGVIFDFNGVLVDSIGLQYESWRRMLEEHGISFSPQDYREKANGIMRKTAIRLILGEAYTEETMRVMSERKDAILQDMVRRLPPDDHRLRLLPGVEEFLQFLNRHGIGVAVASSSSNVTLMLQASGADAYFDHIISPGDYTKSKPDPEIYEVAMARLGVVAGECLLVEDSTQGVRAGRLIGMTTIGLTRSNDMEPGLADMELQSLREYGVIIARYFADIH